MVRAQLGMHRRHQQHVVEDTKLGDEYFDGGGGSGLLSRRWICI